LVRVRMIVSKVTQFHVVSLQEADSVTSETQANAPN
jgi:hypothetical protein